MTKTPQPPPDLVEVVAYDVRWPGLYSAERDLIMATSASYLLALEHIGSTAVAGQRAKPIIDMMASVRSLSESETLIELLASLQYRVVETGMLNRLFLRKPAAGNQPVFHLHLLEHATWENRKERLMRDYLRSHPEVVQAYGELKDRLAASYPHDALAYTKAKTEFIQALLDEARDARGLPRIDAWKD